MIKSLISAALGVAEILLIVVCATIVAGVAIAAVVKKVKGKSGCGGDCGCCGGCAHCKTESQFDVKKKNK